MPTQMFQDMFVQACRYNSLTGGVIAAAHKKGFASLAEIDCAILEPGDVISFFARKPSPESLRHDKLLVRMDQLSAQVAALQS